MPRVLAVLVAALAVIAALGVRAPSWGAPPPARSEPDLARDRVEAARATFATAKAMFETGVGPAEAVYLWSVRWLTAEQDAGRAAGPALGDHVGRMKTLERSVATKHAAGVASGMEKLAATYYRAEAELWATRGAR
jgi:hypothetical protein